MTDQSTDLVLRLLRDIRKVQDDHSKSLSNHDKRFDALDKKIDDWQETTATAVGLATHANLRNQTMEEQIAALAARIERLEKAK
jgi:predicted  nucleic acid-binding Zn-ribbon protein